MSEEKKHPTVAERLAAAQKEKELREAKRREAAELRELEALELESKFESELGARGIAFDIVSNDLGNFVVKRADLVAHKKVDAAIDANKFTIEDAFAFVTPHLVYPTREVFLPILREHSGIVNSARSPCTVLTGRGSFRSRENSRPARSGAS